MTIPYFAMDLEYTYMLMLGTVDILDDDYGTDTTATTNSTTTTTDADHVLISFKIVCMYVCRCSWENKVPSLSLQYSTVYMQ
jgi:hypothetical protein